MERFDYLIIGAGPGGYELAAAAAAKKLKVALVERAELGGTCLNRGCIPTKALAHGADLAFEAREGGLYGIHTGDVTVDYAALCNRRDEIVGQLRQGVEGLLRNVDIRRGTAEFNDLEEIDGKMMAVVTVNGDRLTADKIVIATGSEPAWLPIPGAHEAISSDGLLRMTSVPESMIIIGGGVIGMEFASIFNTLGAKVTVIEYCKEILPQFDKDIAKRLRTQLAAEGIAFMTGAAVTSINGNEVTYTSGDAVGTVSADTIVMAVGRRPVLPAGLDKVGVATGRRGIEVNPETFETSVPGIYAIGDVNGICMLAHVATAQGRRVLGEEIDLDVIPSVVFTRPEVAMAGLTEAQCKERGIASKSAKALYRSNGKALTMNDTSGIVKVIYDPADKRILGAAIMGAHASDLIGELALAIARGMTTDDVVSVIHAHPTLAELIQQACNI